MVALVFGQSQAANQVQERFVGGKGVFNYLRGRCYQAVDPLLGTGGDKGNVWTLVGSDLVAQKQFDAVVLVTIAIGGTSIAQWAPGGGLHEHLMSAVTAIAPVFPFTHVFIAQGETDFLSETPPEDYFRNFAAVIASLRQRGVEAPIFVAIESGFCDAAATPAKPGNPIAEAQRRIIATQEGVYLGADTERGQRTVRPLRRLPPVGIGCAEARQGVDPGDQCAGLRQDFGTIDPLCSQPQAVTTARRAYSRSSSRSACRCGTAARAADRR